MKLISFLIPCYNSAEYVSKCIDSALVGGDDVEVIVVDDGSTDATASIADDYQKQFPEIVKVIHQPNKGHGGAINTGLAVASGLYFKVVDSDDCLDEKAYKAILDNVKRRVEDNTAPDLYITNYTYLNIYQNKQFTRKYNKKLPIDTICDFSKMKAFHFSEALLMHSFLFKRELLLSCGLELPEHTAYDDNIYAYLPLPYVKTLCYLDEDWYNYVTGSPNQTVSKASVVSRYGQQIKIFEAVFGTYSYKELRAMKGGLRKYMFHDLAVMCTLAVYFIIGGRDNVPQRKKAYKQMWKDLKKIDKKLYGKLRYRSYALFYNIFPWRLRRWFGDNGYDIICKRTHLSDGTGKHNKSK